ncbi:MAG: putative rane protein/domain [Acidimicrobiales bacterium]|nr:putative rane protein/domain [Acidimicrobiales bacterium]
MDRSDVEQVQISTLSVEQRDLLAIYLERAAISHELTEHHVTVPEDRARDLYSALAMVVRARPDQTSTEDDRSPTERPPVITRRAVFVGDRIVASRARRALGAVIDWLILDLWALAAYVAGAPNWATAVTLGLYVIVATAVFGRTVGKFAAGTAVVAHHTAAPPGWMRSAVRWLTTSWPAVATIVVPNLPVWVDVLAFVGLVLTYSPLLWDPERRGFHDRAADTVVVLAKQRAARPRSSPRSRPETRP